MHPAVAAEDSAKLVHEIRRAYESHLRRTLAKDRYTATLRDCFHAFALAVRDRLIERWIPTQQNHHKKHVKRVYYLSLEFLIGRSLKKNVLNLRIAEACQQAAQEAGLNWDDIVEQEVDAGLGNGGLGRLAACYMDSLATLNYPCVGYGLRYDFGIFNQRIVNGYQVEVPDDWLKFGYPWEISHPEYSFPVQFEGRVEARPGANGTEWKWVDSKPVVGMPFDLPMVGYRAHTVNTLRLWSAKAATEFDLEDFNRGSYVEAVANKVLAENLTKVLYPNDNFFEGKELRLKQQYFFVSCSVQDILRRFKADHSDIRLFPEKVFIQMNDTHPSLVIPELMRLLMDQEGLGWDLAWEITTSSTGYTNHTILPEALEKWPIAMFERLLPRHLQIIYEINARFLRTVATRWPLETDRLRRMSIVDETGERYFRMANLAIVGSCSTNGVAELHTDLLKHEVLKDFAELWPEKFNNKTNGITQRRFLLSANPPLASLITEYIGDGWITHLDQLRGLEKFLDNPEFLQKFRAAKRKNKQALARQIAAETGIKVSPDSMFDVQVKRMHEYKRQLLMVLYIIVLYDRLKRNPKIDIVPRTFIFGAKAAPGYRMAKLMIKLIHQVAQVIDADPQVNEKIKVVFMPNYRVTLAESIIPAADLSEQISLAGTEASGTGNMKMMLNGAVTIGTLDGANVEILEEVGEENIFIFGLKTEEVERLRPTYNPWDVYNRDEEIRQALQLIERDFFSLMEPGIFKPIYSALLNGGDHYMLLADLRGYIETQERVDAAYRDVDGWTRKSIMNVARAGKFSSDRAILEYAKEIWKLEPCDGDPAAVAD
jgi:starch phosphorylase